jgi:hypothetical protein
MQKYFRSLDMAKKSYSTLPNVVGVGIGYKKKDRQDTDELALVFFVQKKVLMETLGVEQVIPKRIGRVCTDVIEIGEVRLLGRTEKLRPAPPGVSIGHYKVTAGTFGAVVRDRQSGDLLILSNNHVLANASDGEDGKSKVGDPIYQPGSYDGGGENDLIGNLERFIPISRYSRDVTCSLATVGLKAANAVVQSFRPDYRVRLERQGQSNRVDCALARPLKPSLVTPEIMDIGRVRGVVEVKPGMAVQKSGRTSGLTKGKVAAVRVTLNVSMGHGSDVVQFQDQVMAQLKSAPGDSGSLILDEQNQAVGLLFAGSNDHTVCNPIQTVLDELSVDLV